MPPPLRATVVHASAGEDVGRVGVDALPGRAERVDRPARRGAARPRCCARRTLLSGQRSLHSPGTASLSARQEVPEVEAPVEVKGPRKMPVHGTRGTTGSEGCLLVYSVMGKIFPVRPFALPARLGEMLYLQHRSLG